MEKPFWPQRGSYWIVVILSFIITIEWVHALRALH